MSFKSKATGIFAAAVLSVGMTGGAMAQAVGTDADLSVNVENTDEAVGTFTYGFTSGAFNLGDVVISDEEGAIAEGSAELYVEDTRENRDSQWDIDMSATNFNNQDVIDGDRASTTIMNSNLSVHPEWELPDGLQAGGLSNLGDPALVLIGWPEFEGEAYQSHALSLDVPAGLSSGTYTATLSLTATGDIDGDTGIGGGSGPGQGDDGDAGIGGGSGPGQGDDGDAIDIDDGSNPGD